MEQIEQDSELPDYSGASPWELIATTVLLCGFGFIALYTFGGCSHEPKREQAWKLMHETLADNNLVGCVTACHCGYCAEGCRSNPADYEFDRWKLPLQESEGAAL